MLSDSVKCEPNWFRCRSGQCIPDLKRCDSAYDCADRSDEYDCLEVHTLTITTSTTTTTTTTTPPPPLPPKPKCGFGQFRCSDGQCIDQRLLCNQRYDCSDGSDELNCIGIIVY